jgi:tetratricopeptide (TPR) repeat protein
MKRHLILVALLATSANADVWQRAIDPDAGIDVYDSLMTKGDDAANAANSGSINLPQVRKHITSAVEAYQAAAKARPTSGEPWYRIGAVLNSFFNVDCDTHRGLVSPPPTCGIKGRERDDRHREAVAAWDKFEALSPLDPRVNEMLFRRAVLRTKLVSSSPQPKKLLEGAALDYTAILDRADGFLTVGKGLIAGNLAETHMMLGDLDQAIVMYREAIRFGSTNSTILGLAVAFDRDERSGDAIRLIQGVGLEAYESFQDSFREGDVFFVPAGEEEYYFALCDEAFGRNESAIQHWKAFITSGAHPQFQPRAKEHLDRLLAKKNLRWKVPLVPDQSGVQLRLRK